MDRAHTDREYQGELDQLRQRIALMGSLVTDMIADSTRAFLERNRDLARRTIERDADVDRLEVETDDLCLHVLARRQPVASDLRLVATTFKLVTDIERMGDMCVDIAERVAELAQEPPLPIPDDLARMAEAAQGMVRDVLAAYAAGDAAKAQDVILRDRTVDAYCAQVFRELLAAIVADVQNTQRATAIQAIARSIERIGDHATNLAEMVVFMVRGRDIRHPGSRPEAAREGLPRGILFLCVHNAARSQMAEGWARSLLPPSVRIWSAGSDPAPAVHPEAIRAMQEVGIDISRQRPKRISDVPLAGVDTVVTLCAEEVCVSLPGATCRETWVLPDPAAVTGGEEEEARAAFRQIRDQLLHRVSELARRLALSAEAGRVR